MCTDPDVILGVLLYFDSQSAFRVRRCSRALKKLLAANRGLRLWHGVLESSLKSSGSHTIEGGIWLHAMMPEEALSSYATLTSTMGLATDLKFKSVVAVESLIELLRIIQPQDTAAEEDTVQIGKEFIFAGKNMTGTSKSLRNSYFVGRGQHFLGSWEFNAERVKALMRGRERSPVFSSSVKFRCMHNSIGGTFEFEVLLIISGVAGTKFTLSWQPRVTMPNLLQDHLDCFEFHIHGTALMPSVPTLGYDGVVSATQPQTHVPLMERRPADVLEMLEYDCLICAVTVHVYYMGNEACVTAAHGFGPTARNCYQCTDDDKLTRIPMSLSKM